MVKKAFILLLVFIACFSGSGYSKEKSIKYLPPNEDIVEVRRDYSSNPLKLSSANSSDESCVNKLDPKCMDYLKDGIICNTCVSLEEDCKDCCLESLTSDPNPRIKCTSEVDDDYDCSKPFDDDASEGGYCERVTCDYEGNEDIYDVACLKEYVDENSKKYVCNDSGGLKMGYEVSGIWARGCPDKDSEELVPNCSGCVLASGTGTGRAWSCPSSCGPSLSPSFADCNATNPPSPRCNNLSSYYDVEYVWEDDATEHHNDCETCSSASCTPDSPATECNNNHATTCSAKECSQAVSCNYDCNCSMVCVANCSPCPPPSSPCPPVFVNACKSCNCSGYVTGRTTAHIKSYTYSLNDTFRECIEGSDGTGGCTSYANAYEECRDRVNCCKEEVCSDQEDAGWKSNCDDMKCEKRTCYSGEDGLCINKDTNKSYVSGDCGNSLSNGNQCLYTNEEQNDCFKDITYKETADNRKLVYDFVAKSGNNYTVIWQLNTKPQDDIEGLNFYTLVKVFEVNSEKKVYTSMMNIRSLEAAFSIYGTSLVPASVLEEGVAYRIRLYYFLPFAGLCDEKVEEACVSRYSGIYDLTDYEEDTCETGTTIKVDYASLSVLKTPVQ